MGLRKASFRKLDGQAGKENYLIYVAIAFILVLAVIFVLVYFAPPNSTLPTPPYVSTPYIWIANSNNNSVSKFNSSGSIIGTYAVGTYPTAVAVDAQGYAWVVNQNSNSVTKLNPSGTVNRTTGVGSSPRGIVIDSSGYAWVANYGSNSTTRLNPSGTVNKTISTGLYSPIAIAAAPDGYIWTANPIDTGIGYTVISIDPAGNAVVHNDAGAIPDGIAVDAQGNIWVADSGSVGVGNLSVTKIIRSPYTTTHYYVGKALQGLAIDSQGNIWGGEILTGNVTKISPTGQVIGSYAVSGDSRGIAVDAQGNIWAVNTGTNVTKLNSSGQIVGIYPSGDKSVPLSNSISIGDMSGFALQYFVLGYSGDSIPPTISIIYPVSTTYQSVTTLNYTASDNIALSSCWYSTDLGVTNTTITCGDNIAGLSANSGSNTWEVWANDTSGNVNSASVTFSISSPGVIESSDSGAGEWRMFGRFLNNTRYTSDADVANLSSVNADIFVTNNGVDSSPAVYNGYVYIGSNDGKVYQLNSSTMVLINSYTVGAAIHSSPAIANGYVYVGGGYYSIYQLNATTMAYVNNYTTGNAVYSSPAIANGYLYVGSTDNKVYQLNATTMALVHSFTTGNAVYSSPAIANGYVYIGSWDHNIYQLNATTMAYVSNYTTGNIIYSSPVVYNGYVYVGSSDGKVYQLNASILTLVHSYTTGNSVQYSPAVSNGYVYVGSMDHNVYQLNATTLAYVNNYTTEAGVSSSPAVSNGYVYVANANGSIYQLNATTMAYAGSYKTANAIQSSPAVANGYLYIGSLNHNVYRLGGLRDITPPYVYFASPTNGTTYTTNPIAVLISALDASPTYIWWNNGTKNLTYSGIVNLNLADGQYTFTAYANDSYGNFNKTSVTFNVNTASTNVSSCQVLNLANAYYTQIVNIIPNSGLNCIQVSAPNITYDCQNHWISNSSFVGAGIYSDQYNTTIKNCNISMNYTNNGIGIELGGAGHSYLFNNVLNNNYIGIWLNGASFNTLVNDTENNNSEGISFNPNSDNNVVNYNTANNNNIGIYFYSSSNNNVITNSIASNSAISLDTSSINNTFLNTTYSGEGVFPGSQLIREWYYRAYATDANGNPLSGVNISAYNVSGNYNFNLTTDSTGYTPLWIITDYIKYASPSYNNLAYYSNYNIYASNGTLSANHRYNASLGSNYKDVFNLTSTQTPDTTPPYVHFVSPFNNVIYGSATVLLNITAKDDVMGAVNIWWNNGTANLTYTTPINLTLANGQYTFIAYASDSSGNVNSTSVTFNVSSSRDTVPPSVSFASPQSATYNNGTILVFIAAGDNVAVDKVWWNNGTNNFTYASRLTLDLADGSYTFTAYANDTSGNLNYTSVSFSVNTSLPAPNCSNGIVEAGEECDSGNLNGKACSDFGFNQGTLACNSTCSFDTSGCSNSESGHHGGGGGGGTTTAVCSVTCNSSGYACGSYTFCNAVVNCGNCISGKSCVNGKCTANSIETPSCIDTCSSKGYSCGEWIVCGSLQDCGSCDSGQVCNANGVCEAKSNTTFWLIVFGLMVPIIVLVVVIIVVARKRRMKAQERG